MPAALTLVKVLISIQEQVDRNLQVIIKNSSRSLSDTCGPNYQTLHRHHVTLATHHALSSIMTGTHTLTPSKGKLSDDMDDVAAEAEQPPNYTPIASGSSEVALLPQQPLSLNPNLRKGEVGPFNDESPPPEFQIHHANISSDRTGLITAHDNHLAHDPEALFQFIKLQSTQCPSLLLSIRGSHEESKVEVDHAGRRRTHRTTVEDFYFHVDVFDGEHAPKGRLYVVPDDEPAWRGVGLARSSGITGLELGYVTDSRRMPFCARRRADKVSRQIAKRGLPPFSASALFKFN